MRVCDGEDEEIFFEIAVHDAEGELMKNVSAAERNINRPTLRRFCDGRDCPLEFIFKIKRGCVASLYQTSEERYS